MPAFTDHRPHPPVLIAHRGYSAIAPENTCAAFALAVERGADGIECDLHPTADGECAIIHDSTLARTTDGTGRVGRLTLETIRRYSAGSWFSPAFGSEKVPTLADVFACVPARILINLEIKAERLYGTALEEFLRRILHQVYESGRVRSVLCTSFSLTVLESLRAVDDAIRIGFLHHGRLRAAALVRTLQRVDACCYFQNVLTMSRALAGALQRSGFRVGVFTANSKRSFAHARKCGVDYVITNEVEKGRDFLRSPAGPYFPR